MTSTQFKRWLERQGATFEAGGRGGHLFVRLHGKTSVLPMHGSRHELRRGLVEKIKKDLGLQ